MTNSSSEQKLEMALTEIAGEDAARVMKGVAMMEGRSLADFVINCVREYIEVRYVEGEDMKCAYEVLEKKPKQKASIALATT